MSIFDRIRKSATQAADQHGDKITRGLDKAAKAADERTGHKHSDKIHKGVGRAKEGLGRLESKPDRDRDRDPDRGDESPGDDPPRH